MAKAGIYKSDVKKARDALLAQGKHPSVDAVRIALGNTGSKTTIHKYLKELEDEDGGAGGHKASVSEALQDLVERLAAQLQDEANAKVDAIEAQAVEKARQHDEALNTAHQTTETLKGQLAALEARLAQESAAHGQVRDALQRESIARHTAEQQVADLKERLLENESHRRSLEEKHQHAREALEHYRASVKEQRDQDLRRHEQQVQQLQAEIRTLNQNAIIKQEEVSRLNQEGARLVGDLSHAQKSVREQESQLRQLEAKAESLQVAEERNRALQEQLAARDMEDAQRRIQLDNARRQIAELSQKLHAAEIELAATHAKLEAQQAVNLDLKTYLNKFQPAAADSGA